MFTNRKPYMMEGVEREGYINLREEGKKLRWSGTQYQRMMEEQIRFLKQRMLDKESQFEKPYVPGTNYPRMNWIIPTRPPGTPPPDDPKIFPIVPPVDPSGLYIVIPGMPQCTVYLPSETTCGEEFTGSISVSFGRSGIYEPKVTASGGLEFLGAGGLTGGSIPLSFKADDDTSGAENVLVILQVYGLVSKYTYKVQVRPGAFVPSWVWEYPIIPSSDYLFQLLSVEYGSTQAGEGSYINCGSEVIDVSCCDGCVSDDIGYTSQQMSVGLTQELNATPGAQPDACYSWELTASGDGSIDRTEGSTTIYTAPSTNAQCANNPVISLKCGGVVVDTLEIAIDAVGPCVSGPAAIRQCCDTAPPGTTYCIAEYGCDGEHTCCVIGITDSGCNTTVGCAFYPTYCCDASWGSCTSPEGGSKPPYPPWDDTRNDAMKAAGCCPEQLFLV